MYNGKGCSASSAVNIDPCADITEGNCTATCIGSGSCNLGTITVYDESDTTCSGDVYSQFPGVLDECRYSEIATCGDDEVIAFSFLLAHGENMSEIAPHSARSFFPYESRPCRHFGQNGFGF